MSRESNYQMDSELWALSNSHGAAWFLTAMAAIRGWGGIVPQGT